MVNRETYNSLDFLPIYNYVQIINGRFSYLYEDKKNYKLYIDDKERYRLTAIFADMCNAYEGNRSTQKIRLAESANEIVIMQALNRILGDIQIAEKGVKIPITAENTEKLREKLEFYGLKMHYNVNNRIIARRIKAVEDEESKGDKLSISGLMSSIAVTNQVLGTNITHFCESSLYFSYQEQVKKKIESQQNGRL